MRSPVRFADCYDFRMRFGRARWVILAGCASLAITLLIVLSSPTDRTAPERTDEQVRVAKAGAAAPVELPSGGADHPGRIEGRVVRAGKGIPARVTLQEFPRFPGRPLREARADPAGFFAFDGVPPGRHELDATGPTGLMIRRTVIVPAGLDPAPVTLTFPGWKHTFRGRAIHADGRPFSGLAVFHLGGVQSSVGAPTRADGRFEIPGLPPGQFSPEFHSGRGFRARGRSVVHPAPGEVTFVVDHGAQVIRGRVFDARTGAAVPGAELIAVGRNDACPSVTLSARSGPDGGFQFAVPLRDGVLADLMVTAAGFRPWRLWNFPVTGDLEIALSPSPRLTVRVVEADGGAPVPCVPVKASFRSLPDVNEEETLLTDRAGRVTFSSISGDTVLLSVTGPDGRPVQGAWVAVFDQARILAGGSWQNSEAGGSTDAEGRVRIAELPAHTRHILIAESWSSPRLAPVRIDGWLPQDTEIPLSPALSIAGRVIDPNGQPHSGEEGRVFAWCRAGGWEFVGVHEGGKFEESGFAKGSVALVYLPPGVMEDDELDLEPDRYPFPITWVSAGDKDIVFRIPPR